MKRWLFGFKFLFLKIALAMPSQNMRKLILRIFGASIGNDVALYGGAEVRSPDQLIIGSGSSIGHNAILDARRGLEIGNNVNLSSTGYDMEFTA